LHPLRAGFPSEALHYYSLQNFAANQIARSGITAAHDPFQQIALLGGSVPEEIDPNRCISDYRHGSALSA
jgi:hypothetical protein